LSSGSGRRRTPGGAAATSTVGASSQQTVPAARRRVEWLNGGSQGGADGGKHQAQPSDVVGLLGQFSGDDDQQPTLPGTSRGSAVTQRERPHTAPWAALGTSHRIRGSGNPGWISLGTVESIASVSHCRVARAANAGTSAILS
jgi:hypothetical protein